MAALPPRTGVRGAPPQLPPRCSGLYPPWAGARPPGFPRRARPSPNRLRAARRTLPPPIRPRWLAVRAARQQSWALCRWGDFSDLAGNRPSRAQICVFSPFFPPLLGTKHQASNPMLGRRSSSCGCYQLPTACVLCSGGSSATPRARWAARAVERARVPLQICPPAPGHRRLCSRRVTHFSIQGLGRPPQLVDPCEYTYGLPPKLPAFCRARSIPREAFPEIFLY
jgi:hypothetical protein